MEKKNVLLLFGGVSPEHEVSLRSAESVLSNLNRDQYRVFPVGITKEGDWRYYGGEDYSLLPTGAWMWNEATCPALLSPVRGTGLYLFTEHGMKVEPIDVVFPILHGENGEDGSMQGLMQLAGLPCVGSGVAASAASMDKSLTKLVAGHAGVRQAAWELVTKQQMQKNAAAVLERIEARFAYPLFVKPAGTGSSVGVSKARDRAALEQALQAALQYDSKILVEEFIAGKEVECAVLGNENPRASICGEIESGADFYDYEAKYITDSAELYIPARIPEAAAKRVQELALQVYRALGCKGLSRVDFFVTEDNEVVFNEINTIPGFTSISMYPKLFEASGLPYAELLDQLIALAMEAMHG